MRLVWADKYVAAESLVGMAQVSQPHGLAVFSAGQGSPPTDNAFSHAPFWFAGSGISFSHAPFSFSLTGKPFSRAPISFLHTGKSFSPAPISFSNTPISFLHAGKSFLHAPFSFSHAPISKGGAPFSFGATGLARRDAGFSFGNQPFTPKTPVLSSANHENRQWGFRRSQRQGHPPPLETISAAGGGQIRGRAGTRHKENA